MEDDLVRVHGGKLEATGSSNPQQLEISPTSFDNPRFFH
jgi:hypothetical protein